LYALRINVTVFGINDAVFFILQSSLNEMCLTGFRQVPTMALFAKLTPVHVEASVFAFLTGIFNFQSTVLGPMMGTFYSKIFGVTTENLD
jgi:hypothetical protein